MPGHARLVAADAFTMKAGAAGRPDVNVRALLAVGVNADGWREIVGLDLASSEDRAGWLRSCAAGSPQPIGVLLVVTGMRCSTKRSAARDTLGDVTRMSLRPADFGVRPLTAADARTAGHGL